MARAKKPAAEKEVQKEVVAEETKTVDATEDTEASQETTPVDTETPTATDTETTDTPVAPKAPVVERADMVAGGNSICNQMDEYVANMSPSVAQSSDSIALNQRKLYNLFLGLFRLTGKDLSAANGYILEMIRAHRKGAFSEIMVFRGLELRELRLPKPKRQALIATLNLYLAMADTADRSKLAKVVDIESTAASWVNDGTSQQAILQLFGS